MPALRCLRSLLVVTVLACCWTGSAFAQSVVAEFQRAQKLYRAGQDRQALKILKKIVKKFPDHQPSHLLLGRLAFANGKISAAMKHFKKISPELVTPEMGYEYGIVMFQAGNCKKANLGFSRLPSNDRAIGLSYFYRGVCYLRGQQTQRAIMYLKRANSLPPNLQESRRAALAEARRRLKAEQAGRNLHSNPYFVVPTPPPPMPMAPGAVEPHLESEAAAMAKKPAPPAPPAPPPPPPTAGFDNSFTPSLTVAQSSLTQDFYGYKVSNSETRSTEVKLAFNSKYNFEPTDSGKQPYAQLPVDFLQTSASNSGQTTGYVTYADDPGTVIEQEVQRTNSSTRETVVITSPEAGLPLSGAVQIAAGYKYESHFPDGRTDKKFGASTPYGTLTLVIDHVTTEISGNHKESFDATDSIVRIDQTLGAKVTLDLETFDFSLAAQQTTIAPGPAAKVEPNRPPAQAGTTQFEASVTRSWESVNINFAAQQWSQTLAPGQLENPDRREMSNLKLALTGALTFDFGASASVMVAQIAKSDFRQTFDTKDSPPGATFNLQGGETPEKPKKLVSADETDQQAVLTFKVSPFDWFYGQISYDYQLRSHRVNDALYEVDFQNSNPDIVAEFKVMLGLSKSF